MLWNAGLTTQLGFDFDIGTYLTKDDALNGLLKYIEIRISYLKDDNEEFINPYNEIHDTLYNTDNQDNEQFNTTHSKLWVTKNV